MPSASESLYALVTAAARSIIVVGTAKNAGKTTVVNALRAVAMRRGVAHALTSIGRDGEPSDALDDVAKPRVRLQPGTIIALSAGVVPRTPGLVILETGERGALGATVFARVVLPTVCEIAGPPTSRGMRATIDRLCELAAGPIFIDGAIDRIAPLAGGDDAVVLACGAASGATIARVAAVAAETTARLQLPGRDPAHERATVVHVEGALDARDADALMAGDRELTVVVDDPTRIAVRGALLERLRAYVDLRCERPLRIVACTVSPVGREGALAPRELVAAVARATGLPTFDVLADLAA